MSRLPDGFANHPSAFPDTVWRAMCRDIVDGDTIVVEIDTGFNQYRWMSVRVLGVNAPELFSGTNREAGAEAKLFLEGLILGQPLLMLTAKDTDKYGRYLAAPYRYVGQPAWRSVAQDLVDSGNAVVYGTLPPATLTQLIIPPPA